MKLLFKLALFAVIAVAFIDCGWFNICRKPKTVLTIESLNNTDWYVYMRTPKPADRYKKCIHASLLSGEENSAAYQLNVTVLGSNPLEPWEYNMYDVEFGNQNDTSVIVVKADKESNLLSFLNQDQNYYVIDADESFSEYVLLYLCETKLFGLYTEEYAYLLTSELFVDYAFVNKMQRKLLSIKYGGERMEYVDHDPVTCHGLK